MINDATFLVDVGNNNILWFTDIMNRIICWSLVLLVCASLLEAVSLQYRGYPRSFMSKLTGKQNNHGDNSIHWHQTNVLFVFLVKKRGKCADKKPSYCKKFVSYCDKSPTKMSDECKMTCKMCNPGEFLVTIVSWLLLCSFLIQCLIGFGRCGVNGWW